jgi:aminomuconate-semialdehyde/2-hydroxymuconate-6-semialdehyde dehydrogenase
MKAAANGSRPVSLEMGGKNAAIVFADCDFEAAIEGTLRSAFANCGQVCLGTERVYVERPIFDKFVAAMKVGAEKLKIGVPDDPSTGMGPLSSKKHQLKVLSYFADCRRRGRHSRYRWRRARDAGRTGGWLLGAADHLDRPAGNRPRHQGRNLRAVLPHRALRHRGGSAREGQRQQVRPGDRDLDDQDISRAHRVAQKMEVGIAWVNSWFLRDLRTPFGGAKQSGIGREGGVHSLEFYTELKNVCIKL